MFLLLRVRKLGFKIWLEKESFKILSCKSSTKPGQRVACIAVASKFHSLQHKPQKAIPGAFINPGVHG